MSVPQHTQQIAALDKKLAELTKQFADFLVDAGKRLENHKEWNQYIYLTLKMMKSDAARQMGLIDALFKLRDHSLHNNLPPPQSIMYPPPTGMALTS